MKRACAAPPEWMSRAEVCLGTDWFAGPRHKVPHPAWTRLKGLGTHLMAGMLRFRPAAKRQRASGTWRMRRHRPDIKP